MTPHSEPPRFSLAAILLFMATLAGVAAWWGANQRTQRAVREANQLRTQLELYQAELGQLSIIDPTKVHAIGLRMRPEDRFRWKWRIYLPQTRSWQLLLIDGPKTLDRDAIQLQLDGHAQYNLMTALPLPSGEFVMEAAIVTANAQHPQPVLACSVNGQPVTELPLLDFDVAAQYDREFCVGPNDRNVWEPGEQSLLLSLRKAGNPAAPRMVAIWLWELPASPQPD